MSIRNRGKGVWQVRVVIGRDDTGKQIAEYATVRGTKRDAQAIEATIRARSTSTAAHIVTLEQLAHRWTKRKADEWAPSYAYSVDLSLKRILPTLGKTPLPSLSTGQIEDLYDSLDVGPATIDVTHRTLNAVLNYGVRIGSLTHNPAAAAEKPKYERDTKPRRAVPAEHLTALRDACTTDLELALLRLATITGARRGELAALRWCDIDNTDLLIYASISDVGGTHRRQPKANSGRRIALDANTLALLDRIRIRQREEALAAATTWTPQCYILSRASGGFVGLRADSVYRIFKGINRRAGLDYKPHELRHTSISVLLHEGFPVKLVQERVGHASRRMTEDTYGHSIASHDYDRQAAEAVARYLR